MRFFRVFESKRRWATTLVMAMILLVWVDIGWAIGEGEDSSQVGTLTAGSFKAILADFLVRLNEDAVDPDSITGSLQGDVKRPAAGGIKQFLESQGAASVGVPSTVAIGQYDASMIVPIGFECGEPLQFYVESTVVGGKWRMSAVLALLPQPHLPGGVAVLPE